MPPDQVGQPIVLDEAADAVANTLRRTVWRMRLRDGLVVVAAVLAGEAVGTLLGWRVIGILGGAIAASVTWRRGRARRTPAYAAARIERALPECRNVVITAEEMQRGLHRRPEWVWARVMREAADRVRSVEPGRIVPLARVVMSLGVAAVVVIGLLMGAGPVAATVVRATLESLSNSGKVAAAMPLRVHVTISPPAYIAQPSRDYSDPDRITAIEDSTVRLSATGGDRRWRIRFGDQALAVEDAGDASTAVMTASATGYIAIDHREQLGVESAVRLIPVTVSPDRAPTVRVTTPGRDLVVANVSQPVKVEASASDDFGLRSLEVLYTRVSGSGEQFNFEEGTLPITIVRDSPLSWKASGEISLASLKLRPGDAVVYRAVARDGRPADRGLATSETFFIEVAGPGQIALEGFEMPPDQERYALSQQMIVLKIQRLRARERTLSRTNLAESAAPIAAEQRAVRANFIFLMGGDVGDQDAEPGAAKTTPEERVENTAQKDITSAILEMTHAEQGLLVPDTAAALAAAQAAVTALQRAFGRNRYILRTISARSRVDPSRRLSGDLSAVGSWRRDLESPTIDRQTRESRALLSDLLDIAATVQARRPVSPHAFTLLAERALAIDSSDDLWQDVARRLNAARALSESGGDWSAELARAIGPVVTRTSGVSMMRTQPGTRPRSPLVSAWAEERRP